MEGPPALSPEEFRARIIAANRRAVDLWRESCSLLEQAIPTPRDISNPYPRALDLFFIQAYKSFTSLYVLSVRGNGEDAATILRRLLEIAFQVAYLVIDPEQRTSRAERFLAYYWAQVPKLLKFDLPDHVQQRLQASFESHRHLLDFDKKGRPMNWWGSSIRDLARQVGLEQTYDEDYSFLSQMAHGTTQGLLIDFRDDRIELRSDRMIREILVFGTRYVLGITHEWNSHFQIIDGRKKAALSEKALGFDFSES